MDNQKTQTNKKKTYKTMIGKKPAMYCGPGEVCKAACNSAIKAILDSRPYGNEEETDDHTELNQEKKSRLDLREM